ncbi:LOW QUALITY PROTEIN: protein DETOXIFICATION 24-like [Carica papaya]|uniref:LOW QUALITY PROTEIN: protein DETOXIFICATION 24-like n=1 Tax=Carica papaya TaxID=3649 RepID=UPI000B8CF876|nr:LOW QUALITY PROTEIN: protein DETOXIFICATION 24-like [Carica papaya]
MTENPMLNIISSDFRERVWEESKKIWNVAFPAMIPKVSQFGTLVVTHFFLRCISQLHLAAYALGHILDLRIANGVILGMSTATETLCGQAFGAKQYHMMGIYLQRSWIINLITATLLLLPIFLFARQIFTILGEQSDIASLAGYISLWFIPMLYFYVFNYTIQNYLQGQLKNSIIGWLSVGSFLINLLLSWIFVKKLHWGISGAMSATIIANWLVAIGEFVYIFGGWCPKTWRGFTWVAFSDLFPITKLSVSSGLMLCLEIWYNSILILLAGYMKNAAVAISAFSICLNIAGWEFMLCLGFLISSSVRISNELGKGDAEAAKFSAKVIACTSICIGLFFCTLCLIFGNKIGYLFTNDEKVVEYVSELSFLLSISVLLNSIQCVLSGVAIGAGRQSMVAYVNIFCFYFVGIPMGLLLGWVVGLEIRGLWMGMQLGVILQSLVLGYITWTTDWNEQVNRASERLNKWFPRNSNKSNEESVQE